MRFSVSDDCRGCGLCARDCAFGVLTMKEGRPAVRDGREGQCMDCQHCLAVCPVGAVTINGVAAEKGVPVFDLNPVSLKLYAALGDSGTKKIFNYEGKFKDNTHHNMRGAWILARLVLDGARAAYPELAASVRDGYGAYDPEKPDLSVEIPRSAKEIAVKPDEK